MAEPLRPTANKVYARENWIFIPTIASAVLAPTVAEATGASALDVTNIVFADGAPAPSMTTNRVKQNRRLGDTQLAEFIGETSHEGGEVTYQFDPTAATSTDGVKLWEKIPEGTTGYLAHRMGVPKATAIAAGQFLAAVYPVEFGPSTPIKSGDGEAAETAARCTFAVTGRPAFKVAVLA